MNKLLLSLLTPVALFAINGPTIAPTGWDLYLKMGPSGDLVSNGGRFDSFISTAPIPSGSGQPLPVAANMWCVDAQLQFQYNVNYRTNSLGFEEINGEGTTRTGAQVNYPVQQPWTQGQRDVRYEDVGAYNPSDTGDNFVNALRDLNGDAIATSNAAYTDGALFRYRMAAYLLNQYEAFSGGTFGTAAGAANASNLGTTTVLADNAAAYGKGKYDPKGPTSSARNTAIIKAIWAAMNTEGDSSGNIASPTSDANILFWYKTATEYVRGNWNNASKWSSWAVVSAWVADCGSTNTAPCYVRNFNNTNYGDANRVQTFLTERTPLPPTIPDNPVPEPGFYGLLATGVSGLFWFATRRKKNLEN